ncbi:UDP-glucuronosyltransferase 2C1-like isoform X2 [Convolutriloba macropyga]|uniref:UDP-glucuronosyltransferase 2C1-like isoform X2 n=1 Tax=Convolutriloba macropyga TaxID=536237 RepID=UPI003F52135B
MRTRPFSTNAIIRALMRRGHRVTVVLKDDDREQLVEMHLRDVTNCFIYRDMPDLLALSSTMLSAMTESATLSWLNGNLKVSQTLHHLISNSEVSFELILSDVMITGAVMAGRKHNIPVVTQYMGALMPTAANYPPLYQRAVEIAVENPEERPSFLTLAKNAMLQMWYERSVSQRLFNELRDIHREVGLEELTYGHGRFPFCYVHRHSIILSHGAPPLTMPLGQHYEHVHSIGFVSDARTNPPLGTRLSAFLETAGDEPVIFINLGSVDCTQERKMNHIFNHLRLQTKRYFVWSMTESLMRDLRIENGFYESPRLFCAANLPRLTVLLHPKVKLFITNCANNAMLEGVHSVTPMITRPYFGYQPINSNALVRNRIGKLLKRLVYNELQRLIDQMLIEPGYSEMVQRLNFIRNEQIKLGGAKKAVKVIEAVLDGHIAVNRSIAAENVIGFRP